LGDGLARGLGILVFLLSFGLCTGLEAASNRGLTVQVRASEAREAPVEAEVKLYSKSYALVIGIDNYTAGWPRLGKAVSDARKVSEALEGQGFEVTLKTNLKASDLEEAFKGFFIENGRDPDARLFVWFAGHGHTDQQGEGYLIPSNGVLEGDRRRFLRTALSLRDFGKFVRYARSKHVFTIFDSCFAGTIFSVARAAPPPQITRITTRPVRQFLTSGDAGQQVSDDGTFAKLFIEALQGERRADGNGDGYLTASEMGSFLDAKMSNYTNNRQTPRYGKLRSPDFDKGDFVFALPSRSMGTRPAPAPSRGGPSAEIVFWKSIKDDDDADNFQAYLDQYPSGSFTQLARIKIKKLMAKKQVAVVTQPRPALPSPAKPAIGVYPPRFKSVRTFKDCPDCPEMVVVPAGSFTMGAPGEGSTWEKPVHTVTIPRAFAVGAYEVTQVEWRSVMGSTPSYFKGDRNPVETVSWKHAQDFVRKLSTKIGKPYRLLSEAEWEYAARAGTTTTFHTGQTITTEQANFNGKQGRYNKSQAGQDRKRTIPVGSFPPNSFGLYEMHGNVEEWVEDCFIRGYDGSAPTVAPTDGSAWTWNDCGDHVIRGGSWPFGADEMRSSHRGTGHLITRRKWIGFRVARDLSAEERVSAATPHQ
jgi:formylglycine-generating enzyme required for sulfatase activity